MIHGFDDSSKEKVEMYSKGDFLIVEGDVTINAESIGQFSYEKEDLNKYVVIGVMAYMNNSEQAVTASISKGINDVVRVFPYAIMYLDPRFNYSLDIEMYNEFSTATTFHLKAILLKVEE